jgi:hypothetical protein
MRLTPCLFRKAPRPTHHHTRSHHINQNAQHRYPDQALAAHVSAPVFGAFLRARDQLREQQLVQEMEVQYEARLTAEREQLARMAADDLQVEHTRRHIVDRLLTLQCPRCHAAFLDFEGCFALTCHRCRCAFCAYCLADCGGDSHAHVAQCTHSTSPGRGVFGTFEQFTAAQRERRRFMVQEYVDALEKGIRARVIAVCVQDFADLELNIR